MSVVLVVSHSEDLHVDLVVPLIRHQDVQIFRLNADCFPRDYQFWYDYTSEGINGQLKHLLSGSSVDLSDIRAVWLRKPAQFSFIDPDLSEQELAFAEEETEHSLMGLLFSLKCFWVSHPMHLRAAMWKIEQLQRAISCGFLIPETLTTNVPSKTHQLAAKSTTGIIFKALSSSWLAADKVDLPDLCSAGLATTLLSELDLSDLSSVSKLPCHFQHYVEKDYELRVTVIGSKLFAVRIDSQQDERTQVDCRNMSAEIRYSQYQLPEHWSEKILAFVQSYKLAYSALDFIVTPDGQLFFLENNPNGQFVYIEQLVPELNLCQAMADLLVEKALCQS